MEGKAKKITKKVILYVILILLAIIKAKESSIVVSVYSVCRRA